MSTLNKSKTTGILLENKPTHLTGSMKAQTQRRSEEISNVNLCHKKSLIGLRGCEHQQSQSSKKIVGTNLSSYARLSEFMFMFVCLCIYIYISI